MQEPLYIRIFHALVSDIATRDIAPGDRVMENRVATRFDVSRAPARKALAELQEQGLVIPMPAPARGYIVAPDAPERAASLGSTNDAPFTTQTAPTWQRIYSEVENALTQRIAFGRWRLTETGIASAFSVSRTVARDVLARLQARGLVINEGKGWIAPELSADRAQNLYELRALLEPAALLDISGQVPRQTMDQMIQDLHRVVGTKVDGHLLDRFETELHIDLLQRCSNPELCRAMTEAQSLLLAHKFFYQHTAEIYPVEPFLDEHLHILMLTRDGAVTDACEELRQHLLRSSDRAAARIATLRKTFVDTSTDYLERLA